MGLVAHARQVPQPPVTQMTCLVDYRGESTASWSTDKDCIDGKSNRRTVMDGNLSYSILRFVEIIYNDSKLADYKEQADMLLMEMEKVFSSSKRNFMTL